MKPGSIPSVPWILPVLILACLLAGCDGPPRQAVVGVLLHTDTNLRTLAAFKAGLADYGHVEGRNVRYLDEGPVATMPELGPRAQSLAARKPDLIYAAPTPAALAAKEATRDLGIPVLFAPVNDPVSAGLVRDLQTPEGHVTGVRLSPSEGGRLRSLLQLSPGARAIFVPYNAKDPSALASLDQLREGAAALGVAILARPFEPGMSLDPAGGFLPPEAQALFMPRDGQVMSRFREFAAMAEARRIPLSTPRLSQVEQGVLTGYGFDDAVLGRQAARMAHLLLSGTRVADLPVETARDAAFINLEAARRIGLDVPEAFLRQAGHIIRPGQ